MKLLHFMSGFALALAITFFAICARADNSVTFTVGIESHTVISTDERLPTTAMPVPTDDLSVNY